MNVTGSSAATRLALAANPCWRLGAGAIFMIGTASRIPASSKQGTGCYRKDPTCCDHECGSAVAKLVTPKVAEGEPSAISRSTPGETNASGASRRICLSTLPSRAAISASDATRPATISSIQLRALAIAVNKASRVPGFIEPRRSAEGVCTIPLTADAVQLDQGILMTTGTAVALPASPAALSSVVWE